MPKFIYTLSVEVDAIDQDEATYLVYNTKLENLETMCLEIEIEDEDSSDDLDDFPLSLEYDEGEY
jgi:hypothetical protein